MPQDVLRFIWLKTCLIGIVEMTPGDSIGIFYVIYWVLDNCYNLRNMNDVYIYIMQANNDAHLMT